MADSSPTSDFTPDAHPASDFTPDSGGSVMEPAGVKVRRIGGKAADIAGRYDPSNPANVGRVAPIAAGLGTALIGAPEDSGVAAEVTTAALSGAAAPWAEYGTAKALGQPAEQPTLSDTIRGAGMNAGFAYLHATAPNKIRAAGDVSGMPTKEQTVANLKQQVLNRDFLKKVMPGASDEEITRALADPSTEKALQDSIDRGVDIRQTYQNILTAKRADFNARYTDALGPQAAAPVDPKPIAQLLHGLSEGQGQHELTPSFKNWLSRKANELDQMGGTQAIELPGGDQYVQGGAKPFTVTDARELNTELHEQLGGNATNLDRKSSQQVGDTITKSYEKAITDAKGTQEQIGRLKGIDQDYAAFQDTINKLDPRSERFGNEAANAMFKVARQNPGQALYFLDMADKAGKGAEFRGQLLQNILAEARGTSGGPVDQMRVFKAIQDQWRSTDEGKAFLTRAFGQNSPLANPAELSTFLGKLNEPATQDELSAAGRTMGRVGWTGRQLVWLGILGGSVYSLRNHPENWPLALAGIGTMAVAGKLLPRLSAAGQRSYIKMVATPNPDTVDSFLRIAGPSMTAAVSQPSGTD